MPRFKYTLGDADSFVDAMAQAIQRFEGWFAPGTSGYANGSVSYRNNNPGNLRASGAGQPVDSNGYRIFPDYASGYAALKADIQVKINRGWDLFKFMSVYAPSADNNDPNNYANTVARWLGISASTPLQTYQAGGGSAAPAGVPDLPGTTVDLDVGESVASGMTAGTMVIGGLAVRLGLLFVGKILS